MTPRGKVEIIAEAAQGYEGDPTLARMLVRAAVAGHADTVKFQLVYADELATKDYPYYGLFKALEMPAPAWERVALDAREAGLGLVFDVYGLESLRLALKLGVTGVKIHSSDFFNEPLITAAVEEAPHVFFSGGGIMADELGSFLNSLSPTHRMKMTLLYGFQAEPTAMSDNNLARLGGIREKFPSLRIGFMDHAEGGADEATWLGVLALPFGITTIEKHICLHRGLNLEDSVSALDAHELSLYVRRIRSAEAALGAQELTLSQAEMAYRRRAIKVVVTKTSLPAGTQIESSHLALLRVSTEGSDQTIHRLDHVIGRKTIRTVEAWQPVHREDLV
jgi:sialic acid synthase SpsE